MEKLPPPPVRLRRPSYGLTAKHFTGVSTSRLVREMQRLWHQYGDDEIGRAARKRGKYSVYDFLLALHERADRSVFDAAVALLRHKRRRERVQGLAILRELGDSRRRPVFLETWNLLESLVAKEKDPVILDWALACLGWTARRRAFPTLMRFVDHRNAHVREAVANNLVACASGAGDPPMLKGLLRLCDDSDARVRWDALWEFKEHVTADSARIRAM